MMLFGALKVLLKDSVSTNFFADCRRLVRSSKGNVNSFLDKNLHCVIFVLCNKSEFFALGLLSYTRYCFHRLFDKRNRSFNVNITI